MLPEAGEETPMMKAGGTEVTIGDMVEAFGAYTVYYIFYYGKVISSQLPHLALHVLRFMPCLNVLKRVD